ncbi:MAG: hypothetical protein F6K39_41860 [Okeania sp. SIO3B3]|nr:hypothetical protein [Okeania sp. SIO3B3]
MKSILSIAAIAALAGSAAAAPASFLDLGVIGGPDSYTFNTDGSVNFQQSFGGGPGDTDTELGLWDSAGVLLASDDDGSAVGLFSEITASLAPGEYFLGIGEFDSLFADNFVNSGTSWEDGDLADVVLNINGAFAGTQQAGVDSTIGFENQTAFFRVEVIPAKQN